MSYEFILHEKQDGISSITLNRPKLLNSFNRPMGAEVQRVLKEAAEDDSVRCVLLTGAGRGFCAGQDLDEALGAKGQEPPEISSIVEETYNRMIRLITTLEKPIVCAVNGVAAGAGANLAFACDFVFASTTASFIQSFSQIGLIPDSGGTFLLPRVVGIQRAKALMMLADKLPAEEAESLGLVYRVVEPSGLLEESRALCTRLASMPTRGLGLIKRALNASFKNDLDAQLDVERDLQREAGQTHDYREGVQAFLQKRKPVFKGK